MTTATRWVTALTLAGLLLAGRASALPRGTLGTWVESRYFQYGAFARDIDFNTHLFHSDGIWLPANAGVWTTFLEYSSYDAEFLVDAEDVPTGWGRLSLSLGDFTWADSEDDLRREFRQNTLIRGASLSLNRGLQWQVAGGALTERGLYMGTGRVSSGIAVARLGVGRAWPEDRGRWDLSLERQWESEELIGRQLGTLFATHTLGEHWTGTTEGRLSRNDDGRWGSSFAAGVSHQSPRAVLGVALRRVSTRFSGIGLYRDPHVNEVGGRFHGALRFKRNSLGGFFFDMARDLELDELGREPERRIHGRLHVATTVAGPLYAQARLNYRDRSTIDPDSLLVDQDALSGRLETGVRGRVIQGYLSYSRGLFRSRLDEEPDWHEDRIESQVNVRVGPWFRAQVAGQVTERRLPDGTWTSREKRGEMRLMAEPSEKRRGWIMFGRERQDASLDNYRRDNLVFGAGWYQSLPQDFGFELEAQVALSADSREVDNMRWGGRLVHHLSFGSGPVRVNESVEEYGTLSGFVFEDTNGNGVRDPLEPGIGGQALKLGSGPQVITREDGSFYFEKAAIVLDYVRFKAAHLPSRYLPPDEVERELHLNPGEHERIDIPVSLSASVRGRVVAVDDGGVERGVPGILIRVAGSHRDAFTDNQGNYVIGGLPGGEHTLELVDWSIPELHEPLTGRWKTVALEAGELTEASEFRLRSKEPVLLQWFRIR